MVVTSTYSPFDSRPIDTQWQLADAQTVTSSAAATVSSVAAIVDSGGATFNGSAVKGHLKADALIDLGAVSNSGGDNRGTLIIQGSNSSSFASGVVNLAERTFGDTALTGEDADNLGDERVILPFENVREGTIYRYLRLYVLTSGTSGKSVAIVSAYVCPRM